MGRARARLYVKTIKTDSVSCCCRIESLGRIWTITRLYTELFQTGSRAGWVGRSSFGIIVPFLNSVQPSQYIMVLLGTWRDWYSFMQNMTKHQLTWKSCQLKDLGGREGENLFFYLWRILFLTLSRGASKYLSSLRLFSFNLWNMAGLSPRITFFCSLNYVYLFLNKP